MITQAPLPDWIDLCRAIARQAPSDSTLAAPWCRDGDVAGWLSRSAWSLALVALWRQRVVPRPQLTVWIPDYFCNSSLTALRATGARLVFYPLTQHMLPDLEECRKRVSSDPPDLFLLVHYFGQAALSPHVREFCVSHEAWLIEDAAHVLRPVEGVGELGDFVMYSPHKHLPIPDGAVLVVRPNGVSRLGGAALESIGLPALWAHQLHGLQRVIGFAANGGLTRSLTWLLKRVLQKVGVRGWRSTAVPYPELSDGNIEKPAALVEPRQSRLSRRLLAGLITDLERVARLRQRHELLWDALMSDGSNLHSDSLSPAERAVGRSWTPYLCGYQIAASAATATYDDWQRSGLPVTAWPDLPPEVVERKEHHANAWYLRHTRLYLPVHQSLSIGKIVKRWARKISDAEPRLRIDSGKASSSEWQEWIAQAGHSNLLQSWAYGQAKADVSGWQCTRLVFHLDQNPVALVQVLQKRVLGALLISRINRGPLFLGFSNKIIEQGVWAELGRLGSVWRGRMLTAAPELELTGLHLVMMESLGFRQFSAHAWESAWIDLKVELAILRQKLDGKWRNALKSAETAGLRWDVGSSDQAVDWMMARYKELMSEKDFSGSPIDLLLAVRKHLPSEHFVALRAMDGEEAVAGICLVRHGTAATYLLGWNGARGRKLKANQYLLWQAIVYLKQAGLDCFDLGGVDEERTPGIAAFKLGMNGRRYELLGEYWKW